MKSCADSAHNSKTLQAENDIATEVIEEHSRSNGPHLSVRWTVVTEDGKQQLGLVWTEVPAAGDSGYWGDSAA